MLYDEFPNEGERTSCLIFGIGVFSAALTGGASNVKFSYDGESISILILGINAGEGGGGYVNLRGTAGIVGARFSLSRPV